MKKMFIFLEDISILLRIKLEFQIGLNENYHLNDRSVLNGENLVTLPMLDYNGN